MLTPSGTSEPHRQKTTAWHVLHTAVLVLCEHRGIKYEWVTAPPVAQKNLVGPHLRLPLVLAHRPTVTSIELRLCLVQVLDSCLAAAGGRLSWIQAWQLRVLG